MAKFCENCGAPLSEGAKFCEECGTAVRIAPDPAPERPAPARGQTAACPSGMERDENGVYYWIYEQNMWKHTEILGTLLKLFGAIFGGLFLLVLIASGGDNPGQLILGFLGIYAFMAVISVISWAIVNGINHGKQVLIFTMSETKITYGTMPESAEITQKIGKAGFAVGALTGNLTMMGTGLAVQASQSFSNEYKGVKKISSVPKHDLIRVHSALTKNTIYCSPAQYEFVWDYLVSRCPGAKIVRK